MRLPGDDPFENIPKEIQEAIISNDRKPLRRWLGQDPEPSYEAKQDCLSIAICQSSVETIKTLLSHGATLNDDSFQEAIEREELTIFQQLLNHGWNINTTEFGRPAITSVSLPIPLFFTVHV
jgi:hypothetical protein